MKFKSLIVASFLLLGFGSQASAYNYETVSSAHPTMLRRSLISTTSSADMSTTAQ